MADPTPTPAPAADPAAPAPAPTPPPAADPKPTPAPAPTDWRNVPDDVEGADEIRKELARYTTPADAFKSLLHARRFASKAVVIPGKDASPEDVAKFRKQIGVPDKPEAYAEAMKIDGLDLERDDNKAVMGAVYAAAHQANIPPAALKGFTQAIMGVVAQQKEAETGQIKQRVEKADGTLRQEWGSDYDANSQIGSRFMMAAGDKDIAHMLDNAVVDGVPLGEHPAMRRWAAKMGRLYGENSLAAAAMEPEQRTNAESELDSLTSQIFDARGKGDMAAVKALSEKRDDLAKKLYPN